MHAASVHPEPGSNSLNFVSNRNASIKKDASLKPCSDSQLLASLLTFCTFQSINEFFVVVQFSMTLVDTRIFGCFCSIPKIFSIVNTFLKLFSKLFSAVFSVFAVLFYKNTTFCV